jgi:RNA polymerase sigma-70 factor (ECF subfamily)
MAIAMESATTSYDILEKAQKGDAEAFAWLFRKYQRRLAVFVHYRMSPQLRLKMDEEDILQELFLRACRDLHQFSYQSPGSFARWLFRIAENVMGDQARFEGREKRHAVEMVRFRSLSNPAGPEPMDTKTPSRLLSAQEQLEGLIEKLNLLPEDYRQVILLAKVEGLTTEEMAGRMGKTKEATALLLHRALRRFRQLQHPVD